MQAVDVVAFHDVLDDLTDKVAALLQGGVQQRQTVIVEAPLRMLHDDVV